MPPPNRKRYPEKLRPPERVKAVWSARGRKIKERGYSQRWAKFWERVVMALRFDEKGNLSNRWRDEDLHLVAEYVERCRLVELHRFEALTNPYPVNTESGMIRPHGGWERSLAEAREARAIAIELRLTPRARQAAGIDVPDPKDGVHGRLGRGSDVGPDGETGWIDDQVGPDGQPL